MKIFVIFLTFILATENSFALSLDDLGKTTVFLKKEVPKHIILGGQQYEVLIRNPKTSDVKPYPEVTSGTGFLITHRKRIFLVTAAHVAKFLDQKSEVLWNNVSGKLISTNLGNLQKNMTHSMWFFHPKADVAIHPFGFTENSNQALIGEPAFALDENLIVPGSRVYILGYPLGIGVKEKLSPLSKNAELASRITTVNHPAVNPDLKFVLLDIDLAQGYSGAPVFTSPDIQLKGNTLKTQRSRLIGIQSATISDETGGKISLVVPALYIMEILRSDSFKEYEKNTGMLD